ncbi:MAG: S41 family peptidase [Candidatus Melainabacteria bacterium]|nr:S41 family peptidase [Candidatus Melainabacteria bacterium]
MRKLREKLSILVFSFFVFGLFLEVSEAFDSGWNAPTYSVQQVSSDKSVARFDGRRLYDQVLEQLLKYHIALGNAKEREAWETEWRHKYDRSGELDSEEGTDRAILIMVRSLGQRFDYYMNAEQTRQNNEQASGNFVGIGMSLGFLNLPDAKSDKVGAPIEPIIDDLNPIVIYDSFEEGPAYAAGLRTGDRIIAVDGKTVGGMTLRDIVSRIRGSEGTKVSITIERTQGANKEPLSISIVRARVEIPVVKFKDLGDGIAYVKLTDFIAQTGPAKMMEALKKVGSGGALVLDLRGNPGGNLDYAIAIAQMLMAEGEIVELRSRNGDGVSVSSVSLLENVLIESTNLSDGTLSPRARRRINPIIPKRIPVVVLINGGSASASEIIAGALKFSRRGQTVGEPTTGKGVGQVVIPLPYGRTINITNFEFRPNGDTIDWQGIIPDVEVKAEPGKDNQLEEARKLAFELLEKKNKLDRRAREVEQKHRNQFESK